MRQIDRSQPSSKTTEPPPEPAAGPWAEEAERPILDSVTCHLRRFRLLYLGLLLVLLLVFVPPLVTLGRFQRRIATSIGASLGRPVHLSRVSLTLLPLPGFAIENLVVGEDPAFGSEPLIRANSVHATIRIESLWRRQVEFSTISFTEPSVNLVHAPDGRWNIEGVLLQASRIDTAPTAQRRAGRTPRFPYIEATGARLNIKQDQEKLPFSLTDADFALWLPDPHQWQLRLKGHPNRTDTHIADPGTIELEATLGAARTMAQIPFNLAGQWRDAQLGEASRVLLGHDAGWRGQMNLSANIRGTFGESAVTTRLQLANTRPADFVPAQPLSTEVQCFATATGLFHGLEDLRCSWLPGITLTGTVPDIHRLEDMQLTLKLSEVPASRLLTWLRATSRNVDDELTATGLMTGEFERKGLDPWQGEATLTGAALRPSSASKAGGSLVAGDVRVWAGDRGPAQTRHHGTTKVAPEESASRELMLAPVTLKLGGPAPATLDGHFDATGYTLRLTGVATAERLGALASALPPLGDGLWKALPEGYSKTEAFPLDMTATRIWHGQQSWSVGEPSTEPKPAISHHR
jgi:hypothetical protein